MHVYVCVLFLVLPCVRTSRGEPCGQTTTFDITHPTFKANRRNTGCERRAASAEPTRESERARAPKSKLGEARERRDCEETVRHLRKAHASFRKTC